MGVLKARIHLICPLTGEEVDMIKECMRKNGILSPCKYYKHYGIDGNLIYVACERAPISKSEWKVKGWTEKAHKNGLIEPEKAES